MTSFRIGDMDRIVKSRTEFRMKLKKDELDHAKMMEDPDLRDDLICPKCHAEKELVMTPYWGWGRTYYTCYFVCPHCDKRR